MRQVEIKFCNPYEEFSSVPMDGRYAHAWILPSDTNTIYIDKCLLIRYESILNDVGPEASAERERIEVFVAWKLIHELAHLGFRWANGDDQTTPVRFDCEAGEHVEKAVFGGVTGFIFDKVGGKRWSGCQEVTGLIVRTQKTYSQVDEDYIQLISTQCKRKHPDTRSFLPVQLLPRGSRLCQSEATRPCRPQAVARTMELSPSRTACPGPGTTTGSCPMASAGKCTGTLWGQSG